MHDAFDAQVFQQLLREPLVTENENLRYMHEIGDWCRNVAQQMAAAQRLTGPKLPRARHFDLKWLLRKQASLSAMQPD